jgi:hypothetical protein
MEGPHQRNQSVSLVQPMTVIPDLNTNAAVDAGPDSYSLAVAIAITITASLAYFDAGA